MEKPVIITLSKQTPGYTKSRKPMQAGSSFFRFNVTQNIIEHVGRKVKVSLSLSDDCKPCITITPFGQLDHGTPSIISGNLLRIPTKLIDEWSDLGDYSVEFENESVILTKI